MKPLIDVTDRVILPYLDLLLADKTTGRAIIWATDTYAARGPGFSDRDPMAASLLLRFPDVIRPRIEKSAAARQARTKKKAEVFTPAWIVNKMNNVCDEDWFGRKDVFNRENNDHTWTINEEPVEFPPQKQLRIPLWQRYVDTKRLEITCGEAPYLVSRYDVATGDIIMPLERRMGQLDRKLRIVNENTETYDDWLFWALRAFDSCYGYEYQGDNLLIARINVFLTFTEYHEDRWGKEPESGVLQRLANKIAWNLWQMDGLTGTVPLGKPCYQDSLFKDDPSVPSVMDGPERMKAKLKNWRGKETLAVSDIKEKPMGKKLFDYVIGNPPYQENMIGTSDTPVYNFFMDEAYKVGIKVELITPARFLFNAGKTPKKWNEKMLADEHLKVLHYEPKSQLVFEENDIKGGLTITYRDASQKFTPITTFTPFAELEGILKKVKPSLSNGTIDDVIIQQNKWDLDLLYKDHPEAKKKIGSNGKEKRLTTSIFSTLDIFSEAKREGDIAVLGLSSNKRIYRYVQEKYIDKDHANFTKYKVIVPKANGSGALGEVLTTPLIGEPLIGYTQSFIGIGAFDAENEAEACLKYIKTKFARVLLGVLKVTQDNSKGKWKYVPLQDFTAASDIDWTQSVANIDRQLYAKYGLDASEIDFIESHVKEMA